jgi:hypothetical protein
MPWRLAAASMLSPGSTLKHSPLFLIVILYAIKLL